MHSAISIVEPEAGQKIRLSFRANKNQADFCLIVKASRARGRENAAEWLTLSMLVDVTNNILAHFCLMFLVGNL